MIGRGILDIYYTFYHLLYDGHKQTFYKMLLKHICLPHKQITFEQIEWLGSHVSIQYLFRSSYGTSSVFDDSTVLTMSENENKYFVTIAAVPYWYHIFSFLLLVILCLAGSFLNGYIICYFYSYRHVSFVLYLLLTNLYKLKFSLVIIWIFY